MAKASGDRSGVVRVVGVLTIIFGLIYIVAGGVTWGLVASNLRNEQITVSDDAAHFAGGLVDTPWEAWAQANVIEHHALEASGGKTYAQLPQDDPKRQTVMTASFLRASLFTSVVAFGVAVLVAGTGIVLLLLGWALHRTGSIFRRSAVEGVGPVGAAPVVTDPSADDRAVADRAAAENAAAERAAAERAAAERAAAERAAAERAAAERAAAERASAPPAAAAAAAGTSAAPAPAAEPASPAPATAAAAPATAPAAPAEPAAAPSGGASPDGGGATSAPADAPASDAGAADRAAGSHAAPPDPVVESERDQPGA